MRLGLVTDIHEDVSHLRLALAILRAERADRVVFLGDVCRMSEQLDETVALLAEAGAVGIWGNHDFGLCHKTDEELGGEYRAPVLAFMRGLAPRLEIEGCLFTHVEPWLDPNSLEDLWWFEGVPDTPARVWRSFAAVPHRLLFVGHFHRWLLADGRGVTGWRGEAPVSLAGPERYLVGVNAVCEGACAVFDTAESRLVPIDVRGGR